MDSIYAQGFLLSVGVFALEHLALYRLLRPVTSDTDARADWKVLAKLALGVLAILAGCARIAWQTDEPLALLAPAAASAGGLAVALGYVGRYLFDRAQKSAYVRGRLHGMADHADIAAEERDVL